MYFPIFLFLKSLPENEPASRRTSALTINTLSYVQSLNVQGLLFPSKTVKQIKITWQLVKDQFIKVKK